jgi:phosphatidylserine/phosphatidylglycerophosphate/cardiolipin synthase-like enzyme
MNEKIIKCFSSGTIDKSDRAEVKSWLASETKSKKDASILKSQLFAHAQGLLLNGRDVVQTLDVLAAILRMAEDDTDESAVSGVGFSPGNACKRIILSHLESARKSLDICVFTISDNEISDAVLKAHERGVEVRIITDNDKATDEGSDVLTLANNGIEVRVDTTSNHMHHKFSVSDKSSLITGSFNWTRSAELHNQENILEIRHMDTVKQFNQEFEKLWKALVAY